MCHQTSSACISVVEDTAVKESLLIYCKPVELYNILQRRALSNPLFLPRCLQYKIQAKREPRLTDGYVIFNYRDHNNLIRQTEVTSEFSCPFCLLRCSSFKGLRYHLNSSHGIFKFDFWANEEYRAVNVSVKLDMLQSEIPVNDNGRDPGKKAFSFCSKPRKRRRLESPLEKAKHVHPQPCSFIYCDENVIKSNPELNEGEEVHGSCPIDLDLSNSRFIGESHSQHETSTKYVEHGAANANAPSVPAARVQSFDNMEYAQPPPLLLPNAKTRKFSLERADSKSGSLLQKRQFFHSHRAQPMALEQVLSDRDSEDEVDDELSDLEDRRMLDDFVDVTKDEKHLMHLWNSFVRKQRVLADGHVPWACEAFLRLHALDLVQAPAVFWCWRLFMIKLWNHGLVDASTMNNCNKILEKHRKQASQMIASS